MKASWSSPRSSFGSVREEGQRDNSSVWANERTVSKLLAHDVTQLPALVPTPPCQRFADSTLGPATLDVELDKLEQDGLIRDAVSFLVLVDYHTHFWLLLTRLAPCPLARRRACCAALIERAAHESVDEPAAVFVQPDDPRQRLLRHETRQASPMRRNIVLRVRSKRLIKALEVFLGDDGLLPPLLRIPPSLPRRLPQRIPLQLFLNVVPLFYDCLGAAIEAEDAMPSCDALRGGAWEVGLLCGGRGGGEDEEVQAGREELDALRRSKRQ